MNERTINSTTPRTITNYTYVLGKNNLKWLRLTRMYLPRVIASSVLLLAPQTTPQQTPGGWARSYHTVDSQNLA